MAEQTSSGGSVTPTPETPVTGTPTPGSVTPQKPTLTHEDALKRLAELEHERTNAREAEDRLGKKLAAYEKAEREREAAKKAADEAQLSEIERVKKQHDEATQQIQRYKQELVTARVTLAAHNKGIIDPEMAALAIQNSLEFDENGMPSNVEKELDALIKRKPYLAPKPAEPAQTDATPAQTAPAPTAPLIPAMSPGRATITPPSANPPGKVTRLSDVYKRP